MKKSLGAKPLLYPTPAVLVGSYCEDRKANLMTAAWCGVACSDPPCVAVSLRPATQTYHNIKKHQAFTINVPHRDQVAQVDYAGMVSGQGHDKFATLGWTPVASDLVDAPYVEQCRLVLECKLLHVLELGMHTQFVGQVMDVKADESVMSVQGLPDPQKVEPLCYIPDVREYHALGHALGRSYQLGRRYLGKD